jgi:hypothetical protein
MKNLLFAVLGLIVLSTLANAQYKVDSKLLLLNGAFSKFQVDDSDRNLDGYGFGAAYEATFEEKWALGVSLSYTTSVDETDTSSVSFSAIPFNLYGKFLFGNPKVKGFLQAGLGLHSSETEVVGPRGVEIKAWDNGFAFNGGIGAYIFVSEKALINLAYNLSWWDNAYLKNGMGHNFMLGIGFQFD